MPEQNTFEKIPDADLRETREALVEGYGRPGAIKAIDALIDAYAEIYELASFKAKHNTRGIHTIIVDDPEVDSIIDAQAARIEELNVEVLVVNEKFKQTAERVELQDILLETNSDAKIVVERDALILRIEALEKGLLAIRGAVEHETPSKTALGICVVSTINALVGEEKSDE